MLLDIGDNINKWWEQFNVWFQRHYENPLLWLFLFLFLVFIVMSAYNYLHRR